MTEPGNRGPSVILIGGDVTLDNGAQLDTRRPIRGDDWDFALRAALGRSEAFWAKAKTISDVILAQESSPDAWALAWVEKTVRRPKPGGRFTRVRTIKLLDDADHLADRSLLRNNSGSDTEATGSRYRIMPYILRFPEISSPPDPAVFMGSFHSTYSDGSDVVGLNPLSYIVSRWPSVTLVLPHTPVIERKVEALVSWCADQSRASDRTRLLDDGVGLASFTHPSLARQFEAAYLATETIRKADPYVIASDLRITHWVDRGATMAATDLDAALDFVQSRYDLSIGFWDLVRDPVLRVSLLAAREDDPAPGSPVEMPGELVDAARERDAIKDGRQRAEMKGRSSLHNTVWPKLQNLGWRHASGNAGKSYRLAVGPKVEPLHMTGEPESAVAFVVVVHKLQATLNLFAITRIEATEDFLAEHESAIQRIVGTPPDPGTNTIARFRGGGWDGSDEKWQEWLLTVEACVAELKPKLSPVIEAAVAYRENQHAPFDDDDVEVIWVVP